MASSSSSGLNFSEDSSDLSCQTQPEMESSKIRHWSNLSYSIKSSEWSPDTNIKHYNLLKRQFEWGGFFRDFPSLELGKKISEGAQADIYEARTTHDADFNLVAKVMKGNAPLEAFQAQWPIGMLSASKDYIVSRRTNLPLMTILGGTLLEDRRLKGRFAFVMYRRWGDLRLLIDRRMKLERSTVGPFFVDQVIQLMSMIAEDMEGLHMEHDILHRDLKASNVLVWGELGDNVNVLAPSEDEKIGSVVADFECSVGVMGTKWWRAPEILQHLTGRLASSKVRFTRESDVYSYAMTCYEIVSGHIPFEGWSASKAKAAILDGVRPNLPNYILYLRSIIESCWQSDPEKRPNFSDIRMMLKYKQGGNLPNVVVDNECNQNATIIKVEQWGNLQPSPLIQGWERLMRMKLWVSVAEILQTHKTTEMVVQYFEVTDGDGRKVCDENIIAYIVKVLRIPVKIQWITATLDDLDTAAETYLIQMMSETGETSLIGMVSAILSEMKYLIYKVECLKQNGHVKCSMYVEGGKLGSFLPKVLAKAAGSGARLDCMIEIRKLASRDANLELQHVEDAYTVGETYLVLTKSERGGPSLLERISAFLIEMKVQVYKVRCCSHIGEVECAIYVEGSILDSMSPQFLVKLDGIGAPVHCMVVLRKLASRDDNLDFLTAKSSLRAPRSPPAIRIHLELDDRLHGLWWDRYLTVQIICHDTRELLGNVACSLMESRITSTVEFETFEIPSGCCIEVPHFCMEEVTDGYSIHNDDGEGRTSIMDFVHRFFKEPWIFRRDFIISSQIEAKRALKDHLRQYIIGGEVEVICENIDTRDEFSLDILKQSLRQNGLFVSGCFVLANRFIIFVTGDEQ